jgi:Pyruvate/2-oxoacid:ferredoxin oxidoreductase delta subunit
MPIRKVVQIDQDKCDGCELCVAACHEGAIAMVDGKAKLVSDSTCDGLGACLPECPQGAISIVEREAAPFDEAAVAAARRADARPVAPPATQEGGLAPPHAGGCPSALSRSLGPRPAPEARPEGSASSASTGRAAALANWPVQLHLAPIQAPYYQGATLLVAADCVPFAFADFHSQLLSGRTLLIGCPKLDDTSAYLEKLAAILRFNDVRAVEVAFMQVPCCHALRRLVSQAIAASGKSMPLGLTEISIQGEILERTARESA